MPKLDGSPGITEALGEDAITKDYEAANSDILVHETMTTVALGLAFDLTVL